MTSPSHAAPHRRQYVLLIPDGAADRHRDGSGRSPLAAARTPVLDRLAREGLTGRMRTLHPDLPKESLVAQLGMLGWDPHRHYPRGRASSELLAVDGPELAAGDLAFRANLAHAEGGRLVSYNAGLIPSSQAQPLVDRINATAGGEFPGVELVHACDFRNVLIVRGVGVPADHLSGPEPHECHGEELDFDHLLDGATPEAAAVAERINGYLALVRRLLRGERANVLMPWSSSEPFRLPAFAEHSGLGGRSAVVANMDFLHGLAKAGGLEFVKVGSGRPDTDYRAKGAAAVELLESGCDFVVCHVNAPDEAAHMGDVELKVRTLEDLDRWVAGPIVAWFDAHPERLGGLFVAPDHYTNTEGAGELLRSEVHSAEPVPFALWGRGRGDGVERLHEEAVVAGRFGGEALGPLDLLPLLLHGRTPGGEALALDAAPAGSGAEDEGDDDDDEVFVFPTSFAQQRLFFLDRLEPGNAFYNSPAPVRVVGDLRVQAMEQTLGEMVRRHEGLRTTFEMGQDEPEQVVSPPRPVALAVADLSGLDPVEREAAMRELARREAERPFDLESGPLLRARLVRLHDDPIPGTGERGEHVLLLTLHHIVTDGWSLGSLLTEMADVQWPYLTGRPSPLADPPLQYADFAIWQRERYEAGGFDAQIEVWRQRLAGAPPLLELPTDRPRPPVQSYRGARRRLRVPPPLAAGLRRLAAAQGVTPFMLLLATYQVLLHRYSGQRDVLVGTDVANRNRAELEEVVGFFVNQLVLRADFRGNPTFRDFLAQVRERALEAYANQDLPFERLVDEMELGRDLSRNPLFQAHFVLQNIPRASGTEALSKLGAQAVELESGATKFDLDLTVAEDGDALVGILVWATDLFDRATMDAFAGHWLRLLEAVVETPGGRVQDLPLLSAEERRHLLTGVNDTAAPLPRPATFWHRFAARVEETPDAVAAVGPGSPEERRSLTYRQLADAAETGARVLLAVGVRPGDLVGLYLHRDLDLLTAILAVFRAGAAYLPFDPSHPPERSAQVLAAGRCTTLLAADDLRADIDALVASLDGGSAAGGAGPPAVLSSGDLAAGADSALPALAGPEALAYVIFTSGSTGVPKGAGVTQRGMVNHLMAKTRDLGLGAGDRIAETASPCFDISVWQFLNALWLGGQTHVLEDAVALDGPRLLAETEARGLTVLEVVPSLLGATLEAAAAGDLELTPLASLRWMIATGEALPVELARRWLALYPSIPMLNAYGPTECSDDVTHHALAEAPPTGAVRVPIGKPVVNTAMYVTGPLRRGLPLQPLGVAGELCVGGTGVGVGYRDDPRRTAQAFVPDPFSTRPGARLYRTGDRGRWLRDGGLDFLGRYDHQVKIRGFRVELGETEAVLERHPEVERAVVLARSTAAGASRLVAYVETNSGPGAGSDAAAGLRAFVKERLPDYMVPAALEVLDELPLNPNGKIDRKALADRPEPEGESAGLRVPPRDERERILAEVWASLLRLDEVGVHDNFFELGGDSILSIQIVARANRRGLQLTPRMLFEHQTVAELAAASGRAAGVRAEQGPVVGETGLTPAQADFLRLAGALDHYNQAVLLALEPGADPARVGAALGHLLRHHDGLRLRVAAAPGDGGREGVDDAGGWRATLAPPDVAAPYHRVDLAGLSAGRRGAALTAASSSAQRSLSLKRGPVLRGVHFALGDGSDGAGGGRLLLAIHHLAVDGVSWRVLLEDFTAVYGALAAGVAPALPPKTTSLPAWVDALAEHVAGDAGAGEAAYWRRVAERAAASTTPLPGTGGDTTPVREAATGQRIFSLDEDTTAALLREVPPVYGTRVHEALLTALARALTAWTATPAVLVAIEGHGREEVRRGVDPSRTVGWLTAVHPLLLEPGAGGVGDALKAVKEQVRAVPTNGVGYGALVHHGADRGLAAELAALHAEVSFNYQGQVEQALEEGGPLAPAAESPGPSRAASAPRPHLLDVNAAVVDGRLRVSWTYARQRLSGEDVANLGEETLAELRRLVTHCRESEGGYTPTDFPLAEVDQEELDQLIGEVEF